MYRFKFQHTVDDLDWLVAAMKDMTFTPEERTQIDAAIGGVAEAYKLALKAVAGGRKPTPEELRQLAVKSKEMQGHIEQVLGPERLSKLLRKLDSPRRDGQRWIASLRDNLATVGLTDQQKSAAAKLIAEAAARFEKMPNEAPEDPAAVKAIQVEFRKIMHDLGVRLSPVLSADQRAVLSRMLPGLKDNPTGD